MAKIKVKIDPRDECISDMVCVSLCGDVFEMLEEDGKASIKAEFRVAPDNPAEGTVPEDLKECVETAVNSCPVNILHYEVVE